MGRREQGPGPVNSGEEPAGRAWSAVRRALGRLLSQVAVRDLSGSEMALPVAIRAPALAQPRVPAGGREQDWKPQGEVWQASVPQVQTGAHDGNQVPVVRLGSAEAALASPGCRAMPVLPGGGCHTQNADLLLPSFVVHLPDSFLTLPADSVRVQSAGLLSVPGAPALPGGMLNGWGMAAPKCAALRLPRVPDPRVRGGGDAVLSRIFMTRRGREAPPDVPFVLAFRAEGQRLAEAAQLPPDDVTLLGIYPDVPILAVSRIVVADGGRGLRLWLKPDVLRGRNGTRLITLLVGRQISSGRMLQAPL